MEQYYFTELVHTRKVASRSEILVAHLQYCPSRCNFTSAVHTNQPRLKFLHSQPHTVATISRSGPSILIVLLRLAGDLILREGALEQKACYGVRVDVGGGPAVLKVALASQGDWQGNAHGSTTVSDSIPA